MANDIFQRREIKYLVDSRQRALLEQAFSTRMAPDPHGESTVCNIYYDTPDFRLVRASLEKPVYKEKLRMRSYGRAGEDEPVFLELKKKYDGVVYKRRILLPQRDAAAFMAGRAPLPESSQIGRELDYCRRFYPGLQPTVYLCYDRSPWYAADDPEFRVTFDKNIRWRAEDLQLSAPIGGQALLLPCQSLFEIKTAEAIPLWLAELMDKARIRQTSFSKYGEAYKTICSERKGVNCA